MTYFAHLFGISFDTDQEIPDRELSIIYFILDNTEEYHIHCMRGEEQNQVFVHNDGTVVVVDKHHHQGSPENAYRGPERAGKGIKYMGIMSRYAAFPRLPPHSNDSETNRQRQRRHEPFLFRPLAAGPL